jgi:ABC-type phosphate transport system substrate-binding protein
VLVDEGVAVGVRAQGALEQVNALIDSREVLTTLVIAALTGVVGAVVAAYRRRRRITWQVLYDEQVNSSEFAKDPPSGIDDDWTVALQGQQVVRATLAVIKVRNGGSATVEAQKVREFLNFEFPGREVRDIKVRGAVHRQFKDMEAEPGYLEAKQQHPDWAVLPRLDINTGESFQVVVLLSQADREVKQRASSMGGKIVGFPDRPFHEIRRPRSRMWAATVGGVAILVLGTFSGVALANRALTPAAACADGHVTIQGSTAFAPIANQVATAFNQSCPGATFTVRAVGSGTGFTELQKAPDATEIALSDGQQSQDIGFVRKPLGVVYFAVVVNVAPPSQHPDVVDNGLTSQQLTDIFNGRGSDGFHAVGRTGDSGTGQAFKTAVLHGDTSGFDQAGACATASPAAVCTAATSLDVLDYVNRTPASIGYVEADAVPYFTNLKVIKVDGYPPTRDTVLNQRYRFVASEYLYTAGQPAGLTAAYISYLTSDPMSARLRDHAFIACSDLAGSSLGGACI